MSVVQIKNLNRRLDILAKEASEALDKACGTQLWRSMGFDAFDGIDDFERRSIANYYFGQLQTVNEVRDSLS